ncbi:hypothetical protein INR49_024765 [Caranx melampygus]|nr:hypothetical protein INR49_024765 [Caranx melampygus]
MTVLAARNRQANWSHSDMVLWGLALREVLKNEAEVSQARRIISRYREWTAEVVVQTPLYAVFTKSVTTGGSDWFKEQPSESEEM